MELSQCAYSCSEECDMMMPYATSSGMQKSRLCPIITAGRIMSANVGLVTTGHVGQTLPKWYKLSNICGGWAGKRAHWVPCPPCPRAVVSNLALFAQKWLNMSTSNTGFTASSKINYASKNSVWKSSMFDKQQNQSSNHRSHTTLLIFFISMCVHFFPICLPRCNMLYFSSSFLWTSQLWTLSWEMVYLGSGAAIGW